MFFVVLEFVFLFTALLLCSSIYLFHSAHIINMCQIQHEYSFFSTQKWSKYSLIFDSSVRVIMCIYYCAPTERRKEKYSISSAFGRFLSHSLPCLFSLYYIHFSSLLLDFLIRDFFSLFKLMLAMEQTAGKWKNEQKS